MKKNRLFTQAAALLLTAAMTAVLLSGCTKQPQPQNEPDKQPETATEEEKEEQVMTEEEKAQYMLNSDKRATYTVSYDDANTYYLVEPGNADTLKNLSLPSGTDIVREGSTASDLWKRQDKTKTAKFLKFPTDITGYQAICLWIYSEKNTGSKMQLCINCQPSTTTPGKTAYRRGEITVNWTGWKLVTLQLSEFADGYDADFTKVSSIVLNSAGWNMTPDPDTVLWFDGVFFTNSTYEFNLSAQEIGEYNYAEPLSVLRDFQTGGISVDNADMQTKTKLQSVISRSETVRASMNRDGLPFTADMTTTAGITSNYNSILAMARGYAIEGGLQYKDEGLLNDIVYALDYMHEHYYREKTLNSCAKQNNWWDWQIGSAQAIVNTLILISDDISEEQLNKWLAPVNAYDPLPTMTMANRVDIAYVTMAAALLQKDFKRIILSRDALDECCAYVESGDGFYTDGSFVQHDIIAYTGSYGPIMLEALSRLITAVDGTCFSFSDEVINCQYSWAADCFTPLMYHGAFFGLVRGRSICRGSTDVSIGLTAVQGMLRMTEYLNDPDKAASIKSIIKEYDLVNGSYYDSALSAYDLSLMKGIRADASVAARSGYTFAKVFARMDRAIAQLPDYGVGISLSSSRIAKYEAINGENGKGWYTGDGMLYIYTDVNDYDAAYWKGINYYRIPGTTVTTAKRTDENINAYNTLSEYDFVGGAALNNTLVAAMDLESATEAMSFNSDLRAKKAWFIFDEEIVCLGTDITCSDPYDTETIIENRRVSSADGVSINGEKLPNSAGTVSNAKTLYINGFGGVYLSETADVSYNISSGDSVFAELYINHGQNLTGAEYAYVLLPTADSEKTAAYAEAPGVEILSNTADLQAVRDVSSGVCGYVFRTAGSFDGYTVSAPCVLTVNEESIAAADPTQKLKALTVTFGDKTYDFTFGKGETSVLNK